MSGNMYSATFEKVAATAAQDIFQILAPSDAVVVIHQIIIAQDSDAGDAEAEMLNILFHRGSTNGSGGSSVTPAPLHLGGVAAGSTVEVNNTTQGTEGTLIHVDTWNVMNGYLYLPAPESRIYISPSDLFHVELQDAPSDSLTVSGVVYFEELGG